MLENVIIDAQAAAGHVQGNDPGMEVNSSTSPSSDKHPDTEPDISSVPVCDNVAFQELDFHLNSEQILHLMESDRADFMNSNRNGYEAWLSPNPNYFNGSDSFSEITGDSSTQVPSKCQSEDLDANYCNSLMLQSRPALVDLMAHQKAIKESLCNRAGSRKLLLQPEPSSTTESLGQGILQGKKRPAKHSEVMFDDLPSHMILNSGNSRSLGNERRDLKIHSKMTERVL